MAQTVNRKAYAKINLSLDVTGRRDDGYHLVRMIMQSVDLYDELTFEANDSGEINLSVSDSRIPTDNHNLIWKVFDLLKNKYNIQKGANITLNKHIPMAAGMAGGSTDGAATFLGLNEIWNLGLSKKEMCEMAVKLGADIPYCILGGTALSEGIGEELTILPDIPDCAIVIAKPPIDVSTKWCYETLDSKPIENHPAVDDMVSAVKNGDLKGITNTMGNVLEPVTESKYDVIGKIRQILKDNGALNAMMSGSGPTVYGIYDNSEYAQKAFDAVKESGLAPELFISKPLNPHQ